MDIPRWHRIGDFEIRAEDCWGSMAEPDVEVLILHDSTRVTVTLVGAAAVAQHIGVEENDPDFQKTWALVVKDACALY